ncbi:hypothetical protein EER27_12600 [Lysobacter psychrotolerans]|uniref:Uncharacterized protein n=1 Tax=Montanilutibacter psychrotolerans TaxID=1327343 RepID=A0A3M8SRK5_9GAMM|nr:hypothetical protein EER27_12600 [Lysobacter psychrotolerans]
MHIAESKCEEIVAPRGIRDQTAMLEHCDLQRLRVGRQEFSMSTIDISHAEPLLKAHDIDSAAVVAGNTASDRIALSASVETGDSDS